jgi:hypothetical protein
MKRFVLVLSCMLCLSVAAPVANAATDVRFWHRKHKDTVKKTETSEQTEVPKPKLKRTLLHRAKPSREQAARSEIAYGMTGPKSVGWRHPQPGPAGVGAN